MREIEQSENTAGHLHSDTQDGGAGGEGGGQDGNDTQIHRAPSLDLLCAEIRVLHRRREFALKTNIRLENALAAFVRGNVFGFDPNAPEAARKKVLTATKKLLKEIREGGEHELAGMVFHTDTAKLPFKELEKQTHQAMEDLAQRLPVWPWVAAVKGFGAPSLASVIAETGDLGGYANPAKVWKRLGLAVIGGKRQGAPGSGASAEDWIAHGYNPRRRSVSWRCFDSFFRCQLGQEPLPYGVIYYAKKDDYLARGWPTGHADKAARRYVEKRVLRDLWRAWRDAETETE
jgi:hypothetical protein|tara:strand:- start:2342 stop:3208 length:867 start_codon:yes stop_codon:yes gene_type:complete